LFSGPSENIPPKVNPTFGGQGYPANRWQSQTICGTEEHEQFSDPHRKRHHLCRFVIKGIENESTGISQKNLPQLQNRAAQARGARDLQRSAAQAAPRLKRRWAAPRRSFIIPSFSFPG
jgi:hypothetical protein